MSGVYPPLTCKEVKSILAKLGFVPRPRTGSSHEQWVKTVGGSLYKVTVDCPKAPFSQDLVSRVDTSSARRGAPRIHARTSSEVVIVDMRIRAGQLLRPDLARVHARQVRGPQ